MQKMLTIFRSKHNTRKLFNAFSKINILQKLYYHYLSAGTSGKYFSTEFFTRINVLLVIFPVTDRQFFSPDQYFLNRRLGFLPEPYK